MEIRHTNINEILFLDIETVPQENQYNALNEVLQPLWNEKVEALRKRQPERYPENRNSSDLFDEFAGIYSEFGRIVCISVGLVHRKNDVEEIRTKSFANKNEKLLLSEFSAFVKENFDSKHVFQYFCGHNIIEFDMPYICRRMIINNISLPIILARTAGEKPWNLPYIDTMDLWKFGDIKNYTSLKLLCAIFNIPTPKDDIDGSEVARVFYKEDNLPRIARYCEKDVVATIQVFRYMAEKEIINPENIHSSTL